MFRWPYFHGFDISSAIPSRLRRFVSCLLLQHWVCVGHPGLILCLLGSLWLDALLERDVIWPLPSSFLQRFSSQLPLLLLLSLLSLSLSVCSFTLSFSQSPHEIHLQLCIIVLLSSRCGSAFVSFHFAFVSYPILSHFVAVGQHFVWPVLVRFLLHCIIVYLIKSTSKHKWPIQAFFLGRFLDLHMC
jgi:hypothetical protein